MKNRTRRMALCGMMCALGVTVMLMGGVIPLATFCCPALAGLVLIPVLAECGKKMTLACYGATAALSLILCTDKEAALVFAFLGWYPVLKLYLDRIRRTLIRILAKLGVFNLAAGAMLLMMAFVLNMEAAMAEYAEMTGIMLAAFIFLANFTLLVYDRLLVIMLVIYMKKLRPILKLEGKRRQ